MKTYLRWSCVLVFSALFLSSCGGGKSKEQKIKQQQQEEYIKSLARSENIKVLWNRDLGDFNEIGFTFVIDQGISYSIDSKGRLSAIDIEYGNVLWRNKSSHEINAGIGVGNDALFAVDSEAKLLAFSRADGTLLWESSVFSEVLIAPVVAAGNVIVKTSDAKMIGFNLKTGEQAWIYRHANPGLSLRGGSTPVVQGNILFTGFEDGRLVALDGSTGRVLWEILVGKSSGRDEIQRLTDIDAQPLFDGKNLYVGAFQRRIMALDMAGGNVLWTRPYSSFRDFAIDEESLYVIEEKNNILALNRSSGNITWTQDKLNGINLTTISVLGSKLLLTDNDGNGYVINRSSGEIVGRETFSGTSPLKQPVVINDIAYLLTQDGNLRALSLGN